MYISILGEIVYIYIICMISTFTSVFVMNVLWTHIFKTFSTSSLCAAICVYFIFIVLSKCVVLTVPNESDAIRDICYVLVGLKWTNYKVRIKFRFRISFLVSATISSNHSYFDQCKNNGNGTPSDNADKLFLFKPGLFSRFNHITHFCSVRLVFCRVQRKKKHHNKKLWKVWL